MTDSPANDPLIVENRRRDHVRQRLYRMIDAAGARGVSDIHVHPGLGTWTLISGVLSKDPSPHSVISEHEVVDWIHLDPEHDNADPLGARGHTSIAFDTGTYRVRAAFRRGTSGTSVTFRLIPRNIPDADALGVPKVIQNLIRKPAGLILIEGPTGSGKTTLIASLIAKINREQDVHVYLVEDPIEFVHDPVGNSVFTQREVGVHASDYPSAVENALRSKPNVIVVGEMLNPATAKAALHAATTGHLVITTAHAGSVVEAIDSFIGQFPSDEQAQIRSRFSQSLLAICVQRLIPKIGGGLVPVREVMLNNMNFQEIISNGDIHMIHGQMESTEGAFSLEDNLTELVRDGKITPETAMDQTRKPDTMREAFRRLGMIQ